MSEPPVHMELDFFDRKIMSICENRLGCAPDASFWFPLQNEKKLAFFKSAAKITCIDNVETFTKLLAVGIVVDLRQK